MKNPYLRLLLITVNVVLWLAIAIGGLRYVGNQQTYTHFDHKLLKQTPLLLFHTSTKETLTQVIEIPENISNIIPVVNLEYRGDYWHIVQVLGRNPYKSVSLGNFDEFLNKYKASNIGINVVNKQLHRLDLLAKIINSKTNLSVIFTSETTAVLREARKKQPKWIFMSSHSLMARFQLMGAIFVETIMQVDEDIIFVNSPNELSPRLRAELTKRNKKMVLNISQQNDVNSNPHYSNYQSEDLSLLLSLHKANNTTTNNN